MDSTFNVFLNDDVATLPDQISFVIKRSVSNFDTATKSPIRHPGMFLAGVQAHLKILDSG